MAIRSRDRGGPLIDPRCGYLFDSELHDLWGWGFRMASMLEVEHELADGTQGFEPTQYDGMHINPDRTAADAMMAFGIDYPSLINEIRRWHENVLEAHSEAMAKSKAMVFGPSPTKNEKLFDEFMSANVHYMDTVETLVARINKACELIAKRMAPPPRGTGKRDPAKKEQSSNTPEQVRANHFKLFPKGDLDDKELTDAIVKLQTERGNGKGDAEILRGITGEAVGSDPKARRLAARIRRARKDGKTSLPPAI